MLEKVKSFIEGVGEAVNGFVNLGMDALYVGIACFALALILIALAIVIIVVCAKKKKKKKANKNNETEVQQAPDVKEESVKEETSKEEVEPVVEQQTAPTEEVSEPIKDEKKEEVVTAEEPTEEKVEDKKPAKKTTTIFIWLTFPDTATPKEIPRTRRNGQALLTGISQNTARTLPPWHSLWT